MITVFLQPSTPKWVIYKNTNLHNNIRFHNFIMFIAKLYFDCILPKSRFALSISPSIPFLYSILNALNPSVVSSAICQKATLLSISYFSPSVTTDGVCPDKYPLHPLDKLPPCTQ